MNTNYKLILIAVLALLVTSCGSIDEVLRKNKQLAVVGSSYEKDLVNYDGNGNKMEKGGFGSLMSMAKASIEEGKLKTDLTNPDLVKYLNGVRKEVVAAFKDQGYKVSTAEDFKHNDKFMEIADPKSDVRSHEKSMFGSEPVSYEAEPPYLLGKAHKMDYDEIVDLLKDLKKEVAIFIDLSLVKKTTTSFMSGSKVQLGVRTSIQTIDTKAVMYNKGFTFTKYLAAEKGNSDVGVASMLGGTIAGDLDEMKNADYLKELFANESKKADLETLKKKVSKHVKNRLKEINQKK